MFSGPNSQTRRRRSAQRGIALIEALVGMLIFAFGVLALIGLQASMTRAQSSAHYRADASNLASQLFALVQTDAFAIIRTCGGQSRCAVQYGRRAKAIGEVGREMKLG